ncbi:D-arabinono-1,4-lactone oxidase [Baekduia sp.]|jgi:L-gulonolactone oxidase|uniref:D-arabinono-1,4-lactone oxidase n=1 Tax=Baekduia sp. TaxID=2600305 RepID=UPI002DF9C65E|nr:D-arabinono-1,4-lactone oxidase [Baekduia sp.]
MAATTETWKNWAGDQRCAPSQIARPTSEDELAQTVAQAAARGLPVRAVGSGHSFTDIACTDGVLVDTTGMHRVIDADAESGRVTVQAGITLHDLGLVNARHGLALENQGDIDAQTLAGALATATHGTGRRFGNLSTRVVGMRLVTASGDVVEVTEKSDAALLRAARVSLGALGIASQVTIACVPLYTLHRHDQPLPLAGVLDRLDEHVDGSDHFEFFLWPYTRTALTRSTVRSDAAPRPQAPWKRTIQERVIENQVLRLSCETGRRFPSRVPRLNRMMAGAMSEAHAQDQAYKIYASRRDVRFTEIEYAIPRAHAREALERALALVERRQLPILFPFEVRFAAGDDAFLSTAHERETCYIAAHQYGGMEFESFFRGFEEIMDSYGGRPHWGKRHYQSAATLRERYPQWDRFQAVRARMDPDGVFTNDYTRRVLGPVGAPVRP